MNGFRSVFSHSIQTLENYSARRISVGFFDLQTSVYQVLVANVVWATYQFCFGVTAFSEEIDTLLKLMMDIVNMKLLSSKQFTVGAETLLISKLLKQAQNYLRLKEPQEMINSLTQSVT